MRRSRFDCKQRYILKILTCLCVCGVLCCLLAFLLQPMEIYVDDEAKLTLHGLVQVDIDSDLCRTTCVFEYCS